MKKTLKDNILLKPKFDSKKQDLIVQTIMKHPIYLD